MSSKNACPIVYFKSVSPLAVLVALIGMLLIMQGIRGLAASAIFIRVVHFFQTLPVIYLTSVLRVFGFIVSLRFKLNRHTHAVLMDEIERFKRQPGTEPTPENRAIVEDLSGWKYEALWGKGKR